MKRLKGVTLTLLILGVILFLLGIYLFTAGAPVRAVATLLIGLGLLLIGMAYGRRHPTTQVPDKRAQLIGSVALLVGAILQLAAAFGLFE